MELPTEQAPITFEEAMRYLEQKCKASIKWPHGEGALLQIKFNPLTVDSEKATVMLPVALNHGVQIHLKDQHAVISAARDAFNLRKKLSEGFSEVLNK